MHSYAIILRLKILLPALHMFFCISLMLYFTSIKRGISTITTGGNNLPYFYNYNFVPSYFGQ